MKVALTASDYDGAPSQDPRTGDKARIPSSTFRMGSAAPRRHIDVRPDQRDGPQRELENQCDPAGHADRVGPWMTPPPGYVSRQRSHQPDHEGDHGQQDREHDPSEDVEAAHGAATSSAASC